MGSLSKLGKAYAAAIMASSLSSGFDLVFGPAYKGIPLAALVCSALYQDYQIDVGYTYNRKEAKDHGEGGMLVGVSSIQGKRILIVDDVITAGTAIRESFNLLKQYGGIPMGVVIAVDRAEKRSLEDPISAVQSVKKDLGLPVVSIISLPQLQSYLEQGNNEESLRKLVEYRKM